MDASAALLDRIREISWFSAVGSAVGREPCVGALFGYLAECGGGQPQLHWANGWAEAKDIVRQLDDNACLWMEEEQFRRRATLAAHTVQRDELLASVLNQLSELGYAAVRLDLPDEELARVASGAALWTAAQALTWTTVEDLLAPQENPFVPKLRIFELGHWPLGFSHAGYAIL